MHGCPESSRACRMLEAAVTHRGVPSPPCWDTSCRHPQCKSPHHRCPCTQAAATPSRPQHLPRSRQRYFLHGTATRQCSGVQPCVAAMSSRTPLQVPRHRRNSCADSAHHITNVMMIERYDFVTAQTPLGRSRKKPWAAPLPLADIDGVLAFALLAGFHLTSLEAHFDYIGVLLCRPLHFLLLFIRRLFFKLRRRWRTAIFRHPSIADGSSQFAVMMPMVLLGSTLASSDEMMRERRARSHYFLPSKTTFLGLPRCIVPALAPPCN